MLEGLTYAQVAEWPALNTKRPQLLGTRRHTGYISRRAAAISEDRGKEIEGGTAVTLVCVYLPSVHLPPPILYHLPHLFCVFCHAIFSTLAIRTSATPILKSESMQSIQQVGRRGHEGDDG